MSEPSAAVHRDKGVWFLALLLILLLAGGLWFYHTQQRSMRADVEKDLETIARFKVDQLVQWRAERLADGAMLMESRFLAQGLAQWLARPQEEGLRQMILARFGALHTYGHYEDILLLDNQGQLRLAWKGEAEKPGPQMRQSMATARETRGPVFADIHADTTGQRLHLDVMVPVYGDQERGGPPMGFVVLVIDTAEYLYPLIQSWPTNSRSAELLLVRRQAEEVVFLNELRHQVHPPLSLRFPLSRTDLPSVQAALGSVGVVVGRDYRGVEVLAFLAPVPASPWFLVAKVDQDEALAVLTKTESLIVGLLLMGVLVVGGGVLILWQRNAKAHYRALYQAEVAEHRRREKMLQIFDLLPVGISVLDAEGRIAEHNTMLLEIVDMTREGLRQGAYQNRHYLRADGTPLPPEELPSALARRTRATLTQVEVGVICESGRVIWTSVSAAPLADGGLILVTVDITQRKQAEERMRIDLALQRVRSEILRLQTEADWEKVIGVVQAELSGLIEFDHCGVQLFAAESDTLVSYSAVAGKDTSRVPAGFRERLAAGGALYRRNRSEIDALDPAIAAGIRSVVDVPFLGGTLAINSAAENAFSDRDLGLLEGFAREMDTAYRMLVDIRSLVRAEEQLRLTQFTIEHINEEIFWFGPDGLLFYANEAACRSLEYSHQELAGLRITDIDPGFPAEPWEQTWERLKRQDPIINRETSHRTKSGRLVPVEVTASYLKFGNRELVCTFARDIALRKELEFQLQQAQKLEAVGQLTAGMAHNFNNVLQANLANISLAMMKGPPQVQEFLEQAEAAALRGAELVRQLMLFTRAEARESALQAVEMGGVIRNTVSLCRKVTDQAIRLPVDLEAGLPLVRGDARQLEQVLMNLLLNARDALAEVEREPPQITTRARLVHRAGPEAGPARDYVCVEVADNGSGMDEQIRSRIFEPFFTTKEVGKGTGLGLAMVYGILQRHGSWVECHSEPGQGSTFAFYLPLSVEPGPLAAPEGALDSPLRGRETLLVIDDEQLVRRSTAQALSDLGYQVFEAADGLQGLELFQRHGEQIALVLLDLSMPGLSGREVLRQLRAHNPQVKVIVFTGYTTGPEEFAGVAQVLSKPLSLQHLAAALRQSLDA
ncbi:MAG: PAS domain S-box protein [Candidatus Latescibacteria bacterium]|nr:PAS domain S-box protein [Candidatus Latescibacterota bacterium]